MRGFHFLCDDDLVYPPGYVQHLTTVIRDCDFNIAAGWHGSVFHRPFTSLQSRDIVWCRVPNPKDTWVHELGTGALAYHAAFMKVSRSDFPLPNMADVWFALLGQAQEIPFLCPKRAHILDYRLELTADTIYETSACNIQGHRMNTRDLVLHTVNAHSWKVHRPPTKVVSVLMAAYKAAPWIRQALDSILAQELPPAWALEVLVGIDGCPDTLDALRGYRDPRLRVMDFADNKGTYSTFNALLREARGCALLRADADDVVLPGRITKMLRLLRTPGIALVGTYFIDTDEDLNPKGLHRTDANGSWLVSRRAWDRLGGYRDWPCAADRELLHRAEALRLGMAVVPEGLLHYRAHSSQLTRAPAVGVGSPVRTEILTLIAADDEAYRTGTKTPTSIPLSTRHPKAVHEGGLPAPFDEGAYWEDHYRATGLDSGPGSRGAEFTLKADALVRIARAHEVQSVLDLAFGDAEIAAAFLQGFPSMPYTGLDISPTAVAAAQRRFEGRPKTTITQGDIVLGDESAEMVICLDVLFHLPTLKKYEAAVERICRSFTKVAVVAAWTSGIVELYRGDFSPHTFFYKDFEPVKEVQVSERIEIIPNVKYLYVLTRGPSAAD